MRLQDRPRFRAGGAVRFADFFAAARAVRAIAQAGLYPSNCRILDPQEAQNTGAGDGTVGNPGAGLRVGRSPARCVDRPRAGMLRRSWRHTRRPRQGRMRIAKARRNHGATPSSACPMPASIWSGARSSPTPSRPRSPGTASRRFTIAVKAATESAIREATGRPGQVTCRFTHVYPDGPAPYFTFHALGTARRAARPVGRDQAGGERGADRRGRHDHPSSCGRPRPPPVVRQAAAGALCRGAARREAGARSAGPAQSRRPDRHLTQPAVAPIRFTMRLSDAMMRAAGTNGGATLHLAQRFPDDSQFARSLSLSRPVLRKRRGLCSEFR